MADIPPEPPIEDGAGIIKPQPGSPAALATQTFLNDMSAERDWAVGVLLPRAQAAKDMCKKMAAP